MRILFDYGIVEDIKRKQIGRAFDRFIHVFTHLGECLEVGLQSGVLHGVGQNFDRMVCPFHGVSLAQKWLRQH